MDTKKSHVSPVSFYLGANEQRQARIARLEDIAKQLGTTRSVLLQKIADGELRVIPAPADDLRTA
jgi:hypothetical protein